MSKKKSIPLITILCILLVSLLILVLIRTQTFQKEEQIISEVENISTIENIELTTVPISTESIPIDRNYELLDFSELESRLEVLGEVTAIETDSLETISEYINAIYLYSAGPYLVTAFDGPTGILGTMLNEYIVNKISDIATNIYDASYDNMALIEFNVEYDSAPIRIGYCRVNNQHFAVASMEENEDMLSIIDKIYTN